MATELPSYWTRLRSRAHSDFRSYWSLHQFWAVLATGFAGPAVWAYSRHMGNLMEGLQSIVGSGGIGLASAVAGSYLFGFFNAVKKLDEEWTHRHVAQGARIDELEARLSRSPKDESNFQIAKRHLDGMPEDFKSVARAIVSHGKLVGGQIPTISGVAPQRVLDILNFMARDVPYIRKLGTKERGKPMVYWEIVDGFKSVLEELLYNG
jgi:hypothetical protein